MNESLPLPEDKSDDIQCFHALMDEVASREGWDDPEMDAYDQLCAQSHS